VALGSALGRIPLDQPAGHGKGDIASKTVVEAMKNISETSSYSDELIDKLFVSSNEVFEAKKADDFDLKNMKTTGVALVIHDDHADWGHIGDSRLYYFKKCKYVKRTLDHSVPQILCSCGEIKEKDIRHHEDRNKLLRCFGESWENKRYEVDAWNQPLQKGDAFIMCTDGFWDWVDEKQMQKALKKSKTAQECCEMLKDLAVTEGSGKNMDNFSIIVVMIKG